MVDVADFAEFLALSTVMGLSIFFSLPVVMHRRAQGRISVLLLAVAIGILIFLLADVFSDVAVFLASPSVLYLTVPTYDAIFLFAVIVAFILLYWIDNRAATGVEQAPAWTALIIALGIGFQNLTEGLVFGAAWAARLLSLISVVFVGFLLQNVTEGFPIAAPYLGRADRRWGVLTGFFLIGGLPTVVGGVIGYFYNSVPLDILFDGAAIGAIAYVILPMIRVAFRPAETTALTQAKYSLVYLGVLIGFVIGFLANAI
ncbi:MAG: hypothetical protein WA761_06560 [Thermoplasmata archaeon]